MSFITVPSGSGGSSVVLAFATRASASLATSLLGSVYAAASDDSLVTYPATVAVGDVNEFVITSNETGSFTVPAGDNAVIDAAVGSVTIFGNGSFNESVVAGSGNLLYVANGGSGTIVAGAASDTFSGSGAYALLGDAYYRSNASPTTPAVPVIAPVITPPVAVRVVEPVVVVPPIIEPVAPVVATVINITITTGGALSYGSGAGEYWITNEAPDPNRVAIDAGASTVSAQTDGGVYYPTGGSLTFVNNAVSTVVGSATSGPATIFGGNSDGAYLQGDDPAGWMFVNGASDSSITAGLAGGVLAFNGADGVINLFGSSSSAFNYLVGGSGAETLNAAFASGTAVVIAGAAQDMSYLSNTGTDAFFAGSGSSTVIGGVGSTALPDLYAFANGSSGGNDVILDWSQNSGLVFLGYGAKEDAAITAEIASAPTTSSVVSIQLPDKTYVTVVGMKGENVDLRHNPTFLS